MLDKIIKKIKFMLKGDINQSPEILSSLQEKQTSHKSKNKAVGARGEKLAQEFLEQKGYKILEINKRFFLENKNSCEIDIIALDKKELVFVEVKTRSSMAFGDGFEAISKSKYYNIRKGLYAYLDEAKKQKKYYKKFRIDAISVVLKPEVKIKHLKHL